MKFELTPQQVKDLKVFLGRTQLQGSEVGSFVQLVNKIEQMEQKEKEPKKPENPPKIK